MLGLAAAGCMAGELDLAAGDLVLAVDAVGVGGQQ
jgi:hypothetical protein